MPPPDAATSPTGAGLPLGAQRVTRYGAYVDAFNACDLDVVAEFMTEDVVFDWGDIMSPLVGRRTLLDFYRTAWCYFDEQLTVSEFRVDEDVLSAHISNTINVHRDWPDCPIEPMRAGSTFTVTGRMRYRFDGLRICHIVEEAPLSDRHPATNPTP